MGHYSGLSELPAYPCMPSNPPSFFFFLFPLSLLPQGLSLLLFFLIKIQPHSFLLAVLPSQESGTFLDLCNKQKPAALPLSVIWNLRFFGCVEEKASRLLPFVCCVTFSVCTLPSGYFFLPLYDLSSHTRAKTQFFFPTLCSMSHRSRKTLTGSWLSCRGAKGDRANRQRGAWGSSYSPSAPVRRLVKSFRSRSQVFWYLMSIMMAGTSRLNAFRIWQKSFLVLL